MFLVAVCIAWSLVFVTSGKRSIHAKWLSLTLLGPQGPPSLGSHLLRQGQVYHLVHEPPVFRGMATELKVVYSHTNTSGNIIKHYLRTSMNDRTHFFIKNISHTFILERVEFSVVCERWVERHILRERTSSSHIFFREPGGANACAHLQARQRQPDRLRVPRSTAIFCLSKPARVVLITRSPSGYTPIRSECPDAPSSSCLLIKMWQLTKAQGVTRNEPKIHVICYITWSPF